MADNDLSQLKSPEDISQRLETLWEQAIHLTDFDHDFCVQVLDLIVASQRITNFHSLWTVDIAAAIVDVDHGKALLALSRLRVALVGNAVIDPKVMAERLGR